MQNDHASRWARWPNMTDDQIRAWVAHPIRYRFTPCDRCGKRRLFLRLYDVYPALHHFGMVCADCLIEVVSDYAERTHADGESAPSEGGLMTW